MPVPIEYWRAQDVLELEIHLDLEHAGDGGFCSRCAQIQQIGLHYAESGQVYEDLMTRTIEELFTHNDPQERS